MGRRPAPPEALHPFCRPRLSLLSPLASATEAVELRRAPLPENAPTAPELQAHRREHQRTRRRRGKPLRALYRGEKQPCVVNRSPGLLRARQSAPSRRILLFPASFRSFFRALGQSRDEEARRVVCMRSTAPERPSHDEQRRRATMHARRRCSGHPPANPRVPPGAPRCGEHDGAHPVAGDLTAGEICSSEVSSLSVSLTSGVRGPLSVAGGPC